MVAERVLLALGRDRRTVSKGWVDRQVAVVEVDIPPHDIHNLPTADSGPAGRRVGTRLPGLGYCEGVITSFTDSFASSNRWMDGPINELTLNSWIVSTYPKPLATDSIQIPTSIS